MLFIRSIEADEWPKYRLSARGLPLRELFLRSLALYSRVRSNQLPTTATPVIRGIAQWTPATPRPRIQANRVV